MAGRGFIGMVAVAALAMGAENNYPPVASIHGNWYRFVLSGQTTTFEGSGSDYDGYIASYYWYTSGCSPSITDASGPGETTFSPSFGTGHCKAWVYLEVQDDAGEWSDTEYQEVLVLDSFSMSANSNEVTVGGDAVVVTLPAGAVNWTEMGKWKLSITGGSDKIGVYQDTECAQPLALVGQYVSRWRMPEMVYVKGFAPGNDIQLSLEVGYENSPTPDLTATLNLTCVVPSVGLQEDTPVGYVAKGRQKWVGLVRTPRDVHSGYVTVEVVRSDGTVPATGDPQRIRLWDWRASPPEVGPSKTWDLQTDVFTHGVYVEGVSVSEAMNDIGVRISYRRMLSGPVVDDATVWLTVVDTTLARTDGSTGQFFNSIGWVPIQVKVEPGFLNIGTVKLDVTEPAKAIKVFDVAGEGTAIGLPVTWNLGALPSTWTQSSGSLSRTVYAACEGDLSEASGGVTFSLYTPSGELIETEQIDLIGVEVRLTPENGVMGGNDGERLDLSVALSAGAQAWADYSEVRLEAISGGGKIKIWRCDDWPDAGSQALTPDQELTLPATWNLRSQSLPLVLYAEGMGLSSSWDDIGFRLVWDPDYGSPVSDEIKLTVVQAIPRLIGQTHPAIPGELVEVLLSGVSALTRGTLRLRALSGYSPDEIELADNQGSTINLGESDCSITWDIGSGQVPPGKIYVKFLDGIQHPEGLSLQLTWSPYGGSRVIDSTVQLTCVNMTIDPIPGDTPLSPGVRIPLKITIGPRSLNHGYVVLRVLPSAEGCVRLWGHETQDQPITIPADGRIVWYLRNPRVSVPPYIYVEGHASEAPYYVRFELLYNESER